MTFLVRIDILFIITTYNVIVLIKREGVRVKLTTKARYVVMAMADLANCGKDGPVSLNEIALRQGLPLTYLEQLFVKLRQQGLVISSRGANGGYVLGKNQSDIRILDIIKAVEKPLKATRCLDSENAGCQKTGAKCLTHDLWEELSTIVRTFLDQVTLEDVCQKRVLGLGRFGFSLPQVRNNFLTNLKKKDAIVR